MKTKRLTPAEAGKGNLLPFERLHQAGMSRACMMRLERYRRRQQAQGAEVLLIAWPDGTWGLLALHCPQLLPALTSGQIADAYTEAFDWIAAEQLPLLVLRHRFHP